MTDLFMKAVSLSITACLLILAVLVLRLVFRKAPKWIFCALWGLVGLRLICPFSIESSFSMVPRSVGDGTLVEEWADYYVGDTWIIEDSSIYYDAAVFNGREPILAEDGSYYVVAAYDQLGAPRTVENTVVPILGWIWVVGIVAMLVYFWNSYRQLMQRVSTAVPLQGNIKQSEQIDMPFVLGFFRPVIYIPHKITDSDLEYVIAHEKAHIRRKDHWWKPVGFLILSVYWFNPLLWVAYVLLCKDIELACDEKVIRSLGSEQRQDYSLALLNCSIKRYRIAACPLAFGEVSVKERVKSVMSYKKPAFWIAAVGVIACVVVAVCFLTNPKEDVSNVPKPFGASYRVVDDAYYDPLISSRYIVGETTPYYSFTNDYALFESKKGALNWEQVHGKFEEIKLKKDNFDAYFNMMGSDIVWQEDLSEKLRKENEKTWRFDVQKNIDDEKNRSDFYYFMQQKNGDVYLAVGSRETEEYFYEGAVERVWFQYIFKLEAFTEETVEKSDVESEAMDAESKKVLTLDEAISSAILKYTADDYPTGAFAFENHIILKSVHKSSAKPKENVVNRFDEVTVYAMAYYQVFSSYGGELVNEGSSHLPVVMSFEIEENGNHKLTDYWKPSGAGADYVAEVKEAFPDEIEADALDTQKFIKEQQEVCEQKALEYMKEYGSVDQQIAALLDKMTSPQEDIAPSSAVTDYIEWFDEEYEQLLAYDTFTLRYCFEQFLEGGQTDLRGAVMAQACQEIILKNGEALLLDYEAANGQEWFEEFKANADTLKNQYSAENFEKFYPGSWMLKQLMDS